jgi:hypothetical protein
MSLDVFQEKTSAQNAKKATLVMASVCMWSKKPYSHYTTFGFFPLNAG